MGMGMVTVVAAEAKRPQRVLAKKQENGGSAQPAVFVFLPFPLQRVPVADLHCLRRPLKLLTAIAQSHCPQR